MNLVISFSDSVLQENEIMWVLWTLNLMNETRRVISQAVSLFECMSLIAHMAYNLHPARWRRQMWAPATTHVTSSIGQITLVNDHSGLKH